MPKITMEEYEEFPVLPPDTIITVKVEDIAVVEKQGARGPWQKAEFKFKILGVPSQEYGNLVGQHIWGSVPFRFTESPDNKLRQWVEAIFGMELSAGFELDTDLLIGREVRAVVSNYDKKAINPRTGQPYKNHQVDALLPKGSGSAPTQMPAQPVQPVQQPATVGATQGSWTAPTPSFGGTTNWGSEEPPF